jgi:site-specific DNA-methyltransferase (adenine-specific)
MKQTNLWENVEARDVLALVHSPGESVMKPAFSTERGAVYNTDCMHFFAALRDGCIDAVFADPPFNLGKDYGHGAHHDDLDAGDYLTWCFGWMDEAVRVLKPGEQKRWDRS